MGIACGRAEMPVPEWDLDLGSWPAARRQLSSQLRKLGSSERAERGAGAERGAAAARRADGRRPYCAGMLHQVAACERPFCALLAFLRPSDWAALGLVSRRIGGALSGAFRGRLAFEAARTGELPTLRLLWEARGSSALVMGERSVESLVSLFQRAGIYGLSPRSLAFLQPFAAAAAAGGHTDVLDWLILTARSRADASATASAAGNGRLSVLRHLRSRGVAVNRTAMHAAAANGHLDVVRWLRAEGCPWSEVTVALAREAGRRDVALWLLESGCPEPRAPAAAEPLPPAGGGGPSEPRRHRAGCRVFALKEVGAWARADCC